jgi:hypothetical protein
VGGQHSVYESRAVENLHVEGGEVTERQLPGFMASIAKVVIGGCGCCAGVKAMAKLLLICNFMFLAAAFSLVILFSNSETSTSPMQLHQNMLQFILTESVNKRCIVHMWMSVN